MLGDFGLSRYMEDSSYYKGRDTVTVTYTHTLTDLHPQQPSVTIIVKCERPFFVVASTLPPSKG